MDNALLKTQIGIFKKQSELDREELAKRLQVTKIDLRSLESSFEALKTTLQDTEMYPYFVSIMGHLCLAPFDDKEKMSLFWEGLESHIRDNLHKKDLDENDKHPRKFFLVYMNK